MIEKEIHNNGELCKHKTNGSMVKSMCFVRIKCVSHSFYLCVGVRLYVEKIFHSRSIEYNSILPAPVFSPYIIKCDRCMRLTPLIFARIVEYRFYLMSLVMLCNV